MTDAIQRVADNAAAALLCATLIADALAAGIESRGQAVLAVSGGRTPAPTLECLSDTDLDWSRVSVTLVDERWVDRTSPDSNERLVRDHLLKGRAVSARLVPMKNNAATPDLGLPAYRAAFDALPAPMDAVLLGMGEDGHFASLFPRSPALEEGFASTAPCLAVPAGADGDAPPQSRMSLTLNAIAAARTLVLLTSGPAKLAVLEDVLTTGGDPKATPVAALLAARPDTVIVHSAV